MNKGTQLLERERETERFASLLHTVREGNGSLAFISGPPGIGKTELLRSAQLLAESQGFLVLRGRGSEMEQEFAFGVVRQLFEPPLAAASTDDRSQWFSGAASLARRLLDPETEAPIDRQPSAGDPALPLLHGLYWLCANIALHRPLLVSVDDIQWADQSSVRFLMYLAGRLEGLPVAVAVTARASEQSTRLRAQLEKDLSLEAFSPPPLSLQAAATMVRSALGDRDRSFFAACHEATGGNPFLLTELIRELRSAGVSPADASASAISDLSSAGVAKSILLRVQNASPDAPHLARAVALLGDGTALRTAAKFCGFDLQRAALAADVLTADDIFKTSRPLEFVHPLVRSAIDADLSPSERSLGHGRAARLLSEDGESEEKVALHLLQAEPNGDRWVVKTLAHAAAEAASRGAAAAAIALLRRALAEPPSPPVRPQILLALGRVEQRVVPPEAVEHLRTAFELQADPEERARTGLELLRALFNAGRVTEAVEVVQSSIDGLSDTRGPLAMQLEAELTSLLRIGVATSPLANKRLERWKDKVEGRSPPERVLMVHLAGVSALSGGDSATVAELAEKSLGGGKLLVEQSAESVLSYLSLYPLLCADRFDVVESFLEQSFAQARERGSALAFAISSGWRSYLENARGQVREAEADATNAFRLAVDLPNPHVLLAGAMEGLIPPLVETSQLARAEAVLEQCGWLGDVPDSIPFRFLLANRGYLRLAQGRIDLAMHDFDELMGREARTGPTNLFLTPHRSLAGLAAKGMGRVNRARELTEEALDSARSWGAPKALGNALRLAGLVQGGRSGLDMLQEAVAVLQPSQARLVYAFALADLGEELVRLDRRDEGMEKLRSAMDLAHRCGASRLEDRAHKALLALGARPRRRAVTGEESLTPSERRVCRMALDGLSNREIAESLFVTLRTVELHLTHSYQKLGIRSRDRLRDVMTRDSQPV